VAISAALPLEAARPASRSQLQSRDRLRRPRSIMHLHIKFQDKWPMQVWDIYDFANFQRRFQGQLADATPWRYADRNIWGQSSALQKKVLKDERGASLTRVKVASVTWHVAHRVMARHADARLVFTIESSALFYATMTRVFWHRT